MHGLFSTQDIKVIAIVLSIRNLYNIVRCNKTEGEIFDIIIDAECLLL